MKTIHGLEMLVAEKSKQQFPTIRIVFANEAGIASADQNITAPQNPANPGFRIMLINYEDFSENFATSPPPNYETSDQPQRTILQAHEEV